MPIVIHVCNYVQYLNMQYVNNYAICVMQYVNNYAICEMQYVNMPYVICNM